MLWPVPPGPADEPWGREQSFAVVQPHRGRCHAGLSGQIVDPPLSHTASVTNVIVSDVVVIAIVYIMASSDPCVSPVETGARAGLIALALTIAAGGDRPVVDVAVVAGFGVVGPLSLGTGRRWVVAAIAAAAAVRLSAGSAGAVVASGVTVGVALWSCLDRLVVSGPGLRRRLRVWRPRETVAVVAFAMIPVWGLVGSVSLVASAAQLELFGIGEPIVRLTAVHYLYAGMGALALARRLMLEHLDTPCLAIGAVLLTASAPPVVAVGFVLGHPLPQIGGAMLMTAGVWLSAGLLLSSVRRLSISPRQRTLRLLAGLAPWAPMVLAVSWAVAQHHPNVPALSVPDMARFHGITNGAVFVIVGLVATRLTMSKPETAAAQAYR